MRLVRRAAIEVEPNLLGRRLAELLETARPTRVKAGHVRVDHRKVDDLVKQINRATRTPTHRDWRGRVTVSPTSPLAVAANDAREVVLHSRQLPLTDDVLLRRERADEVARALRQAVA